MTVSTPTRGSRTITFLLGKRDMPADGVQDYCEYLGRALQARSVRSQIARLNWNTDGWWKALRELRRQCSEESPDWVILQFTALGWSKRGFPLGAIAALAIARRCANRCAVVFHDPYGAKGKRLVDKIRGSFQSWVIRRLYQMADKAIFADPLEKIEWLRQTEEKAVFIPIGANIPDGAEAPLAHLSRDSRFSTVSIYCLSDPPNLYRELDDIVHAARMAASSGSSLGVTFLGRGTGEARSAIDRAFRGTNVSVSNLGIREPDEVRQVLADSQAMLCVRGPLYPRRGSALAGVACGLPIVAYAGAAEGTPIEEAGVELVPYRDREALGRALQRILLDESLWERQHDRSILAHRRYFSWDLVASKFEAFLNSGDAVRSPN